MKNNNEFKRMQKLAGLIVENQINYDEEYQKIRQQIMDEWGLDDDLDEDNEDSVNREADEIFYEKFGIEYFDV